MGYPLVTVQQVPGYPSQIRFSQNRFLKDPAAEYKFVDIMHIVNFSSKIKNSTGDRIFNWKKPDDNIETRHLFVTSTSY